MEGRFDFPPCELRGARIYGEYDATARSHHSSYGHVETLAYAVAHGARAVDGVQVSIKRVPELMPEEIMRSAGMKVEQPAPVADPQELANYDAIIFGTPTRFGNMSSQMRNFLDQTGPLWVEGALIGKVGSVFTSTSTGGGNETTIVSVHWTLLHHGMIVVGLPYSAPDLAEVSEVKGGSPYGAGTIAAPDGSRLPSQKELNLASFQGHHVAKIPRARRRKVISSPQRVDRSLVEDLGEPRARAGIGSLWQRLAARTCRPRRSRRACVIPAPLQWRTTKRAIWSPGKLVKLANMPWRTGAVSLTPTSSSSSRASAVSIVSFHSTPPPGKNQPGR